MATPRQASESGFYHVVARGTGKQLIFEDDDDRRRFLQLLKTALQTTNAELFAWCLMGNHVHLLIRVEKHDLSNCMRRLCGHYAAWFNTRTGRTGHLFQERFKSEAIDSDEYLLTAVRYIHANPQQGGICPLAQYAWSSYGEYVNEPVLCTTKLVLELLGGKDAFKAFHRIQPDRDSFLEAESRRNRTRAMRDDVAQDVARSVLQDVSLNSLKAMPKELRNEKILALKIAGLTIRQIERFTGIGRGTIERVR